MLFMENEKVVRERERLECLEIFRQRYLNKKGVITCWVEEDMTDLSSEREKVKYKINSSKRRNRLLIIRLPFCRAS